VNRRALEALIRSGSLDRIGPNRATLWNRLEAALHLGEQHSRAWSAGQVDLFGLAATRLSADSAAPAPPPDPDWTERRRLGGERETLGLFLTGHPIDQFGNDLPRFVSGRIADITSDRPLGGADGRGFFGSKPATLAGVIYEVRKRGTRTSVVLDDRSGRIEVTFFDEVFQQHRDLVVKDALVLVEGQLRFDEFSDAWRLAARKVTPLERLREQQARRIVLRWPEGEEGGRFLERLERTLSAWRPGQCQVAVLYAGEGARGALTLGSEWNVRPTGELVEQLESLVGRSGLELQYSPQPGTSSSALG
jgi:DNA polymerase-3 subunit alpha